jgi:acetone carboxylase gamma subunit
MPSYPKDWIADLIDGRLPWQLTKQMMSDFKDADRFDKYIEVLQDRVSWDELILLPIGEHLFIVRKDDGSIVTKSRSGYEFGDYRENWKLKAVIYVRDTADALEKVYPGNRKPDPQWMEVREYYDPNDGTLLEVEAVPPGYPVVHDFLPDLETFYKEWLGREVP